MCRDTIFDKFDFNLIFQIENDALKSILSLGSFCSKCELQVHLFLYFNKRCVAVWMSKYIEVGHLK